MNSKIYKGDHDERPASAAIFSEQDVYYILERRLNGAQIKHLAREFDVSENSIRSVIRGTTEAYQSWVRNWKKDNL